MKTGLLIVDVQEDYLDRPGLQPCREKFLSTLAALTDHFRSLGHPIHYAITRIDADGGNRMPHWKAQGTHVCVEGTPGAAIPFAVAPGGTDRVWPKPYFSAFGNPDLIEALRAEHFDCLVVAGLYSHACVRATVLDAYQAGFQVVVPVDAVASDDPVHGEISLAYLADRAATLSTVEEIVSGRALTDIHPLPPLQALLELRNPSRWEDVIGEVPVHGQSSVGDAIDRAGQWQKDWARSPLAARQAALQRWAGELVVRKEAFLRLMMSDIGKPCVDAEGEWHYGLALLNHVLAAGSDRDVCGEATVAYRPLGVVGIITPWNNPLAIPLGKLAPAILYGNGVVWKPAPQAHRLSVLLLDALDAAGLAGSVQHVSGDRRTGELLARLPGIDALSFTGSVAAGNRLARRCAGDGRRFQGELGGNNGVIVADDADIEQAAQEIAEAAYSFSGQRCTAPRRIIVDRRIRVPFEQALIRSILRLPVGLPAAEATRIGPVISREKQQSLLAQIQQAVRGGAALCCGGTVPAGYEQGCWLAPTLIADAAPDAFIVQEESFGPVALLLEAADFDDALIRFNHVAHGLAGALYSRDPDRQQRFFAAARAGILSLNCARPRFAPEAPFGGWGVSGMGLPEHGRWDRDFYTRPQATYGGA